MGRVSPTKEPPGPPAEAALRVRATVRDFALALPGAVEEFPWGDDAVVKVNRKIFVFLGTDSGDYPLGVTLKLRGPELHEHAMSFPGAAPAGYGLGRSGWVSLLLEEHGAPAADLLCEWTEESYRTIAPRKLVALLDSD